MTNRYRNGNAHPSAPNSRNESVRLVEEPVAVKGFAVTYDRKFNCGNYQSLTPAITIWVRVRPAEGEILDLHQAKERVRQMARENVRKQWQQLQGNDEVVFLGLQPPADGGRANGGEDPILVRTVSVSLTYKVNLGDFNSITPGYTDWADVQSVAHSPSQLHIALARLWHSLWQNTLDEISRARGQGATGAFFGLPAIEVGDLAHGARDGYSQCGLRWEQTVMHPIKLEPTYRVVLGDVRRFRILQVGCGGTGSALALALGALAYHARQKGIQVELTLLDHDVIEERNVGRQSFAAGSGGAKCVDLAWRLNASFGLDVVAWPVHYTCEVGEQWFAGRANRDRPVQLLIDCVDNTAARREIDRTLARYDGRLWQLSCGNERANGQVLLGNSGRPEQIQCHKLGLCSGLPYPYVQEPGLLEEEEAETTMSCAVMAQQGAQSLMINRLAATIAGQLVTEMVLEQQVTQMGVYFSLSPPAMRARLLTERAVQQPH